MKNLCIDCDCEITDKNKKAKYPAKNGMDRYKCKECYEKNPKINQETECYARVVG